MKCIYEGCPAEILVDDMEGFCGNCFTRILEARERLKKNGGKVEGRRPVFNYDLGNEPTYDAVTEIALEPHRWRLNHGS